MPGQARTLSASTKTVIMAVTLAVLGGWMLLAAGPDPVLLLPYHTPWWLGFTVLLAAFTLSELAEVHVEFHRESYTVTLNTLPLMVGALVLPAWHVVLARALTSLVVAAIKRPAAIKTTYNTASCVAETSLVALLLHLLVPRTTSLTVGQGFLVYGVLALVDMLVNLTLIRVITWHTGDIAPRAVLAIILPGVALTAVTTLIGLLAFLLVADGTRGITVLLICTPLALVGQRAYSLLQRRHHSLTLVHEFVSQSHSAVDAESLVSRLSTHAVELLRASWVEVLLTDHADPSAARSVIRVEQGERPAAVESPRLSQSDWVMTRVLRDQTPILVPRRTHDAALRRWLASTGLRDAIILPLVENDEVLGVLVAADRTADAVTFTEHDVALAETLAMHTATALRSTNLLDQLRHDASHDSLTSLANRAMLDERLKAFAEPVPADPDAEPALLGILLLDLNRFKDVNDALGHHAGDRLLIAVAKRLTGAVGEGALVTRLGGDEFAILLPRVASAQHAAAIAARAAGALRVPVSLGEHLVTADACVGVAVCRPGEGALDLLRQADLAMYAAKNTGQPFVVYTPDLDRGHAERLALVADLQLAINRQELSVVYQPKLDLATRRVTGVEALVRWQHPTRGPVAPDVFIPIAESTGLIDDVLRTVLATSLTQIRIWRDLGLDLSVAVNLSARNLNDETLPTTVVQALSAAALPAEALVLEITESSVMGDPGATLGVLHTLAGLGVRLSLDDFGTGYSSLSYLQTLPVQELKIDRSFVRSMTRSGAGPAEPLPPGQSPQLPTGERAEMLVRTVVDLCHGLGLDVIAEGVEDDVTLERLAELRCSGAQGYVISRPMSPVELMPLLSRRAQRLDGEGQGRLRIVG